MSFLFYYLFFQNVKQLSFETFQFFKMLCLKLIHFSDSSLGNCFKNFVIEIVLNIIYFFSIKLVDFYVHYVIFSAIL